ncbi:hypothetical protein HNP46_000179 [Pseudomonas nitritireducens]|uniref:Metallophosphoesterase n=1 Tax=Pseudomonas nitroreducens TaxID=46680 RepID=A0A7W7NY67_PSENT|nr:hypothetical protein [Pseudomonas nitritireducens]MBB4861368.1 hypothetical protein [Pseudomonas nitritireducens]
MRVLSISSAQYSRVLVVSDLFGNFAALSKLVEKVDFDAKKDLLILNGNFLGFTYTSKEASNWLSKPWVKAVAGLNELAMLTRLSGQKVASLVGQWMNLLDEGAREALRGALEALPLAIEVETAEGIAVCASRPLPEGCQWKRLKADLLVRDGEPMTLLRGFEGRLPGLKASRVIVTERSFPNPDILLSISGFQTEIAGETPDSLPEPVLELGNRLIMLSSGQTNQGPRYRNDSLVAYLELNSFVASLPGGGSCLMGFINTAEASLMKIS